MKNKKKLPKVLTVVIASLLSISLLLGGCGSEPPIEATPAILWLNGTHAILTVSNDCDVQIFGGMKRSIINTAVELVSLEDWWGITSKAEMDKTIDSLVIGMHNQRFLEEIEDYDINNMSQSEFEEALKDVDYRLDALYFQNMFDAYQKFGDKAILGWDLSRAVQLCANGYIADFYTYEEATDKAREIGETIQNTFDSWDDFFASYFYGYVYWSEDDTEDTTSEYAKRIKIYDELKKDSSSPINLDWYLNLNE